MVITDFLPQAVSHMLVSEDVGHPIIHTFQSLWFGGHFEVMKNAAPIILFVSKCPCIMNSLHIGEKFTEL